jgi:hypothetical protein
MYRLDRNKSALAALAFVAFFAFVFLIVVPCVNPPQPRRHGFYIFAGGVSRAIVKDKTRRSRSWYSHAGKLPRLPHHIDFESSAGDIEVYVVPYPSGDVRAAVEEMQTLTEQLKAGQPPPRVYARGSGQTGRIMLHHFPYGWVRYLVLVRSANQSEVSLVVH